MNNYIDVLNMYKQFDVIKEDNLKPQLIADKEAIHRLNCLREEINELEEGYKEQDLPKIADSLVDLVIFALGTAALHSLPWEELFAEVQRANKSKQVGNPGKERNEGVEAVFDLIKPEGWKPPEIAAILSDWGWQDPNAVSKDTF